MKAWKERKGTLFKCQVCLKHTNWRYCKLKLIQIKLNQMQVFEERGKPLRTEKRTNKLNPHMTPLQCSIIPSSFTQCRNWNDCQIWHKLSVLAGCVSVNKQFFFQSAQAEILEAIFNKVQICRVFIAVFAYKDAKKYHFQKTYLLAELVHFFFDHTFVIRFYVQFDQTTPRSAPAIATFSHSTTLTRANQRKKRDAVVILVRGIAKMLSEGGVRGVWKPQDRKTAWKNTKIPQ